MAQIVTTVDEDKKRGKRDLTEQGEIVQAKIDGIHETIKVMREKHMQKHELTNSKFTVIDE